LGGESSRPSERASILLEIRGSGAQPDQWRNPLRAFAAFRGGEGGKSAPSPSEIGLLPKSVGDTLEMSRVLLSCVMVEPPGVEPRIVL
jgi:hypothetical protein